MVSVRQGPKDIPELRWVLATGDYVLARGNGPVIAVDCSGSTPGVGYTVTLFDSDLQPADGKIHRYWVHKMAGSNDRPLHIVVAGGEPFVDGLPSVTLRQAGETVQLGGMHPAAPGGSGWMRISSLDNVTQARRAATWLATNFSAPAGTPVPFDTQDREDNANVMAFDLATYPTRLTAAFAHEYNFSYAVGAKATTGTTWEIVAWIRVTRAAGGSVVIPGSTIIFGGSNQSGGSGTMPSLSYHLEAGDYAELLVAHTSLTGYISSAVLTGETEV